MTVQIFPVQAGLTAKNVPWILAKSNVAVPRNSTNTSGTGGVDDDEEVTHATITLPPNILVGSNSIHIHAVWRHTSSVSTKSLIMRLGGTSIGSLSQTTNTMSQLSLYLHADDTYNDQKAPNNSVAGDTGAGSSSLDTTKDNSTSLDITLTSKWGAAVASETITLEAYRVTVWPA